ncbi:hypothetical protein BGZ73_006395 [Actinomortierella ambigua]|nr:hypothetical protein BGZ73_006395 [Actinomortierella ambigua]
MKFTALAKVATALCLSLAAAAAPVQDADLNVRHLLEKRAIDGLNDYNCKPSAKYPRPVVLVHSTLLTEDSWKDVAPVLIKRGMCVYALTYGRWKNLPGFGAVGDIRESGKELSAFVNNVLQKTNTTQVDLVGHSQGGILGRYWAKFLDGAGKIHTYVGVSPIQQGTDLSGIVTFGRLTGTFDGSKGMVDFFCPACYQMVYDSTFIKELNAGGDTIPGVKHYNIATKFDEVVTPWKRSFQNGSGASNTVLQDLCMVSINEHLTMVNSPVVIQFILNSLDPSNAKTANCLTIMTGAA